ncbi:MAG: hypothetical protein UT02_C0002G0043 [Parcubacteria group bacterium GW2011_GWC2_38_7]|nr:MAG: hypothetical protein UT02_C0002G0043 [Parcubacteria group bacterium GW2011_GWC2_38_7]
MNKKLFAVGGMLLVVLLLGTGCTININNGPTPTNDTALKKTPAEPTEKETPSDAKETAPATTMVNCGSDFTCFTQRANTCLKTKYLDINKTESEEAPGITTIASTEYEITGIDARQCNFTYGVILFQGAANETAIQRLMAEEGKTRAEIDQEVVDANTKLKESYDPTARLYCKTSDGKNIVDHISKLFKGQQKIVVNNDQTTYGDNIFCTQK